MFLQNRAYATLTALFRRLVQPLGASGMRREADAAMACAGALIDHLDKALDRGIGPSQPFVLPDDCEDSVLGRQLSDTFNRYIAQIEAQRLRSQDENAAAHLRDITALAVERDNLRERQALAERKMIRIAAEANEFEARVRELYTLCAAIQSGCRTSDGAARLAAESADTVFGEMQDVVAASEKLSDVTRSVALQIESMRLNAHRANDVGCQGIALASSLRGSVHSASEILGSIQTIASQTGLLALNATIEAARAGEAGRGFAVVAEEVKKLAGQSSAAAARVSDTVENISSVVEEAVGAIEAMSDLIAEAACIADEVFEATESQSLVSEGTSCNVAEALRHTSDLKARLDHALRQMQSVEMSADNAFQIADRLTDEMRVLAGTSQDETHAATARLSGSRQKAA